MTKLNNYWASKFHSYMGYRAVDDDDDLRAFNHFIKVVRQTKHTPKRERSK
jgi:hypothetical protein